MKTRHRSYAESPFDRATSVLVIFLQNLSSKRLPHPQHPTASSSWMRATWSKNACFPNGSKSLYLPPKPGLLENASEMGCGPENPTVVGGVIRGCRQYCNISQTTLLKSSAAHPIVALLQVLLKMQPCSESSLKPRRQHQRSLLS